MKDLLALIRVPASADAKPEDLLNALVTMIDKAKRFPVDRRLDFARANIAVDSE
jgi:hypothetical protein